MEKLIAILVLGFTTYGMMAMAAMGQHLSMQILLMKWWSLLTFWFG